jgi:hypothetical protein
MRGSSPCARQLIGQIQAGLSGLDRVDVAHHVGDCHVRRRQLFYEARLARQPGHRQAVAFLRDARPARGAQRRQRVVVNLAAGHDRNLFVEQVDQAAKNPALGLAAQAEQDEIVPRQNRVHQLRDDGLLVADDPWKERLAGLQLPNEIVPHLLLDGSQACAGLLTQSPGSGGGRHKSILSEVDSRNRSVA